MRTFILYVLLLFTCYHAYAQPQEAAQLHETARSFMRQGDYANAILVLQRCISLEPGNTEYSKDLALSFFFKKDNARALEIIKPVLDRNDADDQSYQIAGYIYKDLGQTKECEKLFRKGLKKFPASGALYSDLGELLWAQQDYSAINEWEKGIEYDPSYARNYYHAARFYYLSTDKTWSLFYGEIYVNMEPQSTNSPEIRNILLEGYKKLFTDSKAGNVLKNKKPFERRFLEVMKKQSGIASIGINPESLTMIRTRFILEWMDNGQFPHKLFEFQQQLLREGLFPAYNQWLFGPAQDLAAYNQWIGLHQQEHDAFIRLQKSRVFKIPAGQYYH
jgi:tetratricopeptide (TPR) repeat protein